MNKDHPFAALTRAYAMAYMEKKEKFVQSIYIDILLYESLLKEKRSKLKQQIDCAIDQNDRDAFKKLVRQLNIVEKQLNA